MANRDSGKSLLGREYLDHSDQAELWAAWISQLFKWGRRNKYLHWISYGQCCDQDCTLDLGEETSLGVTFCFAFFCFGNLIGLMLRRYLWLGLVSFFFFFFNKCIYLFIYFWLRWVSIAACGLSLVAAGGGCPLLRVQASHCGGFSLLRSTGSRHAGFSSWGARA